MDTDLKIGVVFSLASLEQENKNLPTEPEEDARDSEYTRDPVAMAAPDDSEEEEDEPPGVDVSNTTSESTETATSSEEQGPESPPPLQVETDSGFCYTLESITPPVLTPELHKGNVCVVEKTFFFSKAGLEQAM